MENIKVDWSKNLEEEVLNYKYSKLVYLKDSSNKILNKIETILSNENIEQLNDMLYSSHIFIYENDIKFFIRRIAYEISDNKICIQDCAVLFLLNDDTSFKLLSYYIKNAYIDELLSGEFLIGTSKEKLEPFFSDSKRIIFDEDLDIDKIHSLKENMETLRNSDISDIIFTFINCENENMSTLNNIISNVNNIINNSSTNQLMLLKKNDTPNFLQKDKSNKPKVRIVFIKDDEII